MYLDPGSAGLIVQAIFAAFAAALAFFGRSRTWVMSVWFHAVGAVSKIWRRSDS
jgi:hypothetical protein